MEIVSVLLGHSNSIITPESYGKVIQRKVSEEMQKLKLRIDKNIKHLPYKHHGQSSGLSSVVPFVPFGCSSQSSAVKASSLHSADTTQHNKNSSLKISSYFYCAASFLIFTRSLPYVRQGYYIYNTASFRFVPQPTLHYIPAVLCLSPLVFSAVAPSQSHRGWLR